MTAAVAIRDASSCTLCRFSTTDVSFCETRWARGPPELSRVPAHLCAEELKPLAARHCRPVLDAAFAAQRLGEGHPRVHGLVLLKRWWRARGEAACKVEGGAAGRGGGDGGGGGRAAGHGALGFNRFPRCSTGFQAALSSAGRRLGRRLRKPGYTLSCAWDSLSTLQGDHAENPAAEAREAGGVHTFGAIGPAACNNHRRALETAGSTPPSRARAARAHAAVRWRRWRHGSRGRS